MDGHPQTNIEPFHLTNSVPEPTNPQYLFPREDDHSHPFLSDSPDAFVGPTVGLSVLFPEDVGGPISTPSDQVDSLVPPLVQLRLSVRDATKAFVFYEDDEASSETKRVCANTCMQGRLFPLERQGGRNGKKGSNHSRGIERDELLPMAANRGNDGQRRHVG